MDKIRKRETPAHVKRHLKERIFREKAVHTPKPIPVGSPAGKAQRAWNSWEQEDRIKILVDICGVPRNQTHLFHFTHWLALSLYIRKCIKRFVRSNNYTIK